MASAVKSNAPLIIAPNITAPSDGTFSPQWNWSTESAWSGNNWAAEVGTPSLSTDHGFIGQSSIKSVTAGVTQTSLNKITSIAGYVKATAPSSLNSGQYYAGCWVRVSVYTGSPTVVIQGNFTTSADATIVTNNRSVAVSAFELNRWNCLILKLTSMTAANASTWERLELRFTLNPNGGTATCYTDGFWFGRAIDLADMTGAVTTGANFQHPYKINKKVLLDFDKSQAGKHYARRYNAGFYSGEEQTTGFGEADRDEWQSFMDYTMDGTAMTVFYDRTSNGVIDSNILHSNTNYYAKTLLDQSNDGLEQIPGTPLWQGKIKWKETLA